MDFEGESSGDTSLIHWHASSLCGTDACVEVAISDNRAFVRSSKNTASGYLVFDAPEWTAFLAGVRNDEFDID